MSGRAGQAERKGLATVKDKAVKGPVIHTGDVNGCVPEAAGRTAANGAQMTIIHASTMT